MKYQIKLDDEIYEVEVVDVHARPILARVDGETYEVWPQNEVVARPVVPTPAPVVTPPPVAAAPKTPPATPPPSPGFAAPSPARKVSAPIPGVITKVLVQPGEAIQAGTELCVLEAMKMNNSIRASFAGQVSAVRVTVGQHVKHGETLIEFAS